MCLRNAKSSPRSFKPTKPPAAWAASVPTKLGLEKRRLLFTWRFLRGSIGASPVFSSASFFSRVFLDSRRRQVEVLLGGLGEPGAGAFVSGSWISGLVLGEGGCDVDKDDVVRGGETGWEGNLVRYVDGGSDVDADGGGERGREGRVVGGGAAGFGGRWGGAVQSTLPLDGGGGNAAMSKPGQR